MTRKKRKQVYIFCLIIFLFLVVLLFMPIKAAVEINNIPKNKGDFFVCKLQSTTGPNWVVIDNEKYQSVIIEGVDPQNILSDTIQIDSPNIYIIYGEIISNHDFYGETYPVITSTGFDVVYPIERGASLRFFVPKHYLTIFDYKWIKCSNGE